MDKSRAVNMERHRIVKINEEGWGRHFLTVDYEVNKHLVELKENYPDCIIIPRIAKKLTYVYDIYRNGVVIDVYSLEIVVTPTKEQIAEKYIVCVALENNYSRQNEYYFWTNIPNLNEGDYVVCHTVTHFSVGKITKISPQEDFIKPTKWIVDKIDMEAHNKRKEKETRLKEVKKKMMKRKSELGADKVYELLSKTDENMAQLMDEYRKIENE